MSYYPDLSHLPRRRHVFRVGWLDGEYPFETARPPKWLVRKLWRFCNYGWLLHRGFHECNLPHCPGPFIKNSTMIRASAPTQGEKSIGLGADQICVFGRNRRIYVAPNLIYHYVTVHHYKPPDEFIEALEAGPCPPEPEYMQLIRPSLQITILTKSLKKPFPLGTKTRRELYKAVQNDRPIFLDYIELLGPDFKQEGCQGIMGKRTSWP